ncbi:ran-binding protein 9-like [Watersipora subatra]|uniref:ran-binding protein 9-like n=1 Tax=Watersipora subatra TaxID=2589382 RepID=UPI00355B0458
MASASTDVMDDKGSDDFIDTLTRLRTLYPSVKNLETELPSCWNQKDKHEFISLSNNYLTVNYKGQGKTPKDAASVRTNHPIPSACGIYYFEVKIISKGRDGYMGIGLSAREVNTNRLPGWDNKSYGYHGDDGNSFCCSGQGESYGPTFTTGDMIGCCVNLIDGTCFFTKNGVNLGVAFTNVLDNLYPTVGLQTPGEVVEANFGQQPFLFDIEDYMQEYRVAVQNQIDKVSLGSHTDLLHTTLHRIISTYLVHYGYCSTAETFAKHTDQSLNEEIISIKNRQRVQKLILSGQVSDAIALTQELYPGLLDSKPQLLFMLKCRQFVEMVNGTDTESISKPSPLQSHSSKASPCKSPHSYRSAHGSPGNSPYRHSVASPLSTHSNGGSTSHGSDASNGCMVTNGSGFTSPDLNGASHSLEDLEDDEHMDIDTAAKSSSLRPLQSGNDSTLMRILQFGRELRAMNNKLNETQGTNETNNAMLEEIFSLLAYADPWNSPLGSQLQPVQREPVCAALNSAILESYGLPQVPVLETVLGQTEETLNEMTKAGIGASAFAQLTDLVPLCKGKKSSLPL